MPVSSKLLLLFVFATLPVAFSIMPADAGSLNRSISREIAERITGRQTMQVAEREALERILRDLDARVLRQLEARYGKYIPAEVLESAQQKPATFLEHASYQEWLRRAYPDVSSTRLQGVVGDTHPITNGVTVDRNQALLDRLLSHERLHQLSHARFRQSFGEGFDEGVTDYLAAQVSKDLNISDIAIGYPGERELTGMLAARVGDDAVAKAYFRGDFDGLAQELDDQLGAGSFSALQRHLQREDHAAARALLLGSGR